MRALRNCLVAMVFAVVTAVTGAAVPVSAEDTLRAATVFEIAPYGVPTATVERRDGPMSYAQLGSQGPDRESARGAECPIGSGAYCSDESPYCFVCHGEYACCWSSEVWRCCD